MNQRTKSSVTLWAVITVALLNFSKVFATEKSATDLGKYGPLDKVTTSALYDYPLKISDRVYSAIGATQPPTYENAGHNNNLSFVIGDEAVLVVNGGSNNSLARALHHEIRKITDKPIKYVISENGQSHAFLGNHYWKEQGATLIGHIDAQYEIEDRGYRALERMRDYAKEYAQNTEIVYFDETFEDTYQLDLGNLEVIAKVYGSAHSPGDISVLVTSEKIVLAGDIAFHVRMPPIFDVTDTKLWIESFDAFAKETNEWIIVPGHGEPTDIYAVTAGTRDYLVYLRAKVAELLSEGGSLEEAYQIDQTPFANWHTFEELAARNAGRVFERMEFE